MQHSNHHLKLQVKFILFVFSFAFIHTHSLLYAQGENEDKTLSPFFFVKCDDPSLDQLPLKETSAEVNISGVIADVTVRQTYCNTGTTPLEAIYIFPASTKAAVYAMQMHVGNRILIAKIKEKEEARQEYEEAREEGKTASLLEQQRPNVFQMNVANILPGDTIMVEMKYTELLVPVEGEYEFVYPTVVGPRYTNGGEEWNANPYQHEGKSPLYRFDISVHLNAGMPVQNIECISHAVTIEYDDIQKASCSLSDATGVQGNKDFILHYSLAENDIETGLLLYEGEEENFFLAMIQPPPRPSEGQIPPREYVFIMDVSGSMNGYPIEISKTLLTDLLHNLKTTDKFNVLFFAGGSDILSSHSLDATSGNINSAISLINNRTGAGGTELLPALQRALTLPGTEDYARSFVIATDGYVAVEKEAFDLIRNNLNNANFFPFGIGTATNRYIIEGMAHVGMTEPVIVTDTSDAYKMADEFRKYIQYPVLTNISCSYQGFSVYDVEPVSIPDALAERPIILFGKWNGNPEGSITLTGTTGNSAFTKTLTVNQYAPDESNSALKYLWARHKIQLLEDYGSFSYYNENKQEIIDLGLKYNLLTQYTSFVAIDSVIRNESDTLSTVTQPLPLPEGVSDYAVSNATGLNYSYAESFYSNFSGKRNSDTRLINVYPNPFSSKTILKVLLDDLDNNKPKFIRVFNMLGEIVFEKDISYLMGGEHQVEIDFGQIAPDVPEGIYFAKLIVADKMNSTFRLHYIP